MMETCIEEWKPGTGQVLEDELQMLGEMLCECVHDGASIGFVLPFEQRVGRAYWEDSILPPLRKGARRVFLARSEGRIVGTVQIDLDTMPNQRHRADVKKLMVRPEARRRGIARALMLVAEECARSEGRTLLTLDTRAGDAGEPLYLSLGYVLFGVIPRYSRSPFSPDLENCSFMYKELDPAGGSQR